MISLDWDHTETFDGEFKDTKPVKKESLSAKGSKYGDRIFNGLIQPLTVRSKIDGHTSNREDC